MLINVKVLKKWTISSPLHQSGGHAHETLSSHPDQHTQGRIHVWHRYYMFCTWCHQNMMFRSMCAQMFSTCACMHITMFRSNALRVGRDASFNAMRRKKNPKFFCYFSLSRKRPSQSFPHHWRRREKNNKFFFLFPLLTRSDDDMFGTTFPLSLCNLWFTGGRNGKVELACTTTTTTNTLE